MAYLKERSRKRAASKRREGHVDRVKEKLQKEDEWWKRLNQPGKGRKVRVFPLAEGELAGEVQAAPLSKKAKTALLEEEEQAFLELPQHRLRTKELPPSGRKLTPKRRAAKQPSTKENEGESNAGRQTRSKEKAKDQPRVRVEPRVRGIWLRSLVQAAWVPLRVLTLAGQESISSLTRAQAQLPFPKDWWER